jgi:hypothetical protein
MALRLLGHIDLPEHRGAGGFDHADIHSPSDRLYVAQTVARPSPALVRFTRGRGHDHEWGAVFHV